ncbi:MAG: hypothetical protein ACK5Q5_23770 [Planctomycetaceae bacterium]
MTCPECGAPLQAPEDQPRFFCQFCGTQVEQSAPRPEPSSQAGSPYPRRTGRKPSVPIPEKLQIEDYGGDLAIRWRWFTPVILFLISLAVAWNAFLIG